MKMSDVFALPVRRVGNTLADEGGYADGEDEADAAVHAINCHDGLVDAVEALLFYPDLADRKLIAELLSKAKGE